MANQHGTNYGYQRHRRARENACPECLEAHRVYRNGLTAKAAAAVAAGYGEALDDELPVEEPLNVLADHRENLRTIRAAMRAQTSARVLPGLSRQRDALVAVIVAAEAQAAAQ